MGSGQLGFRWRNWSYWGEGFIIGELIFWELLFIRVAGLATYCIWGTYWGIKIAFGFVSSIFFGNNIYYTNIWDAIKGRYSIMLWFYLTLLIIGYFIGVLGGGIYKQIRLLIIKYS